MTISLVSSTVTPSANGNNATATLNSSGADFIVVCVSWATGGTTPTLVDGNSNTWTPLANAQVVDYLSMRMFYCFAPTVGSGHTFTVSGTGSAPTVAVLALTGVTPAGTLGCLTGASVLNDTSLTGAQLFGSVCITGLVTIGTSHTITAGWSKATTDFNTGVNVGGGIGWKIQSPASVQTPAWSWTGIGDAALQTFTLPVYTFTRLQSTPVLANHNQGGGTIGGIQADAIAAPAACWDGTRWVMTVSIWNIVAGTWSSAFFTSPDLVTWTYVASSLVQPSGGDYIVGNSGLAWFGGLYYWAYSHYPAVSSAVGVTLKTSSDLVTWSTVGDPIISSAQRNDPSLVVNPGSGNLELWAIDGSKNVVYATSANGSSWSAWSAAVLTPPFYFGDGANFGEPQAFYSGGVQFCTCDISAAVGHRFVCMFVGPSLPCQFPVVLAASANAWENSQVFDSCCVGAVDRADGRGTKLWMLYAGGDNFSSTDDTDSCIGLAYLDDPTAVPSTFAPSLFRQANLTLGGGGRFFVNPLL